MRTIIAGGRNFNDSDFFIKSIDEVTGIAWNIDEVVSGRAKGADTFGETWAYATKTLIKIFPADWNKYGKSAGLIRNQEMADYADALVAFWDKKSRGTRSMISIAIKQGLYVKVFYYEA